MVAAHCAPNAALDNLVVGQLFYLASNYGQAAENHGFDAVYVHPLFNGTTGIDLALLHLTTKSKIQPVRLDGGTKEKFEPMEIVADSALQTIGVGRLRRTGRFPTFTQNVGVSHVDGTECEIRWENETDLLPVLGVVSKDYHLCAEGIVGTGICNGNSAGPVLVPGIAEDGSEDIQVGLTTSTTPCVDGLPEVYTRLGTEAIHTWIQETKRDFSKNDNDRRRRRLLRRSELRSLQTEVAAFNGFDLQPKIVGGYQAPPNRYPYYVGIWNQNQQYCGGSLIDKEWVLTAAHCASAVGHTVVIGQYFYLVGNHGQYSEYRTIDAFYEYPVYNVTDRSSFDVGLIHLNKKSKISPVPVDGLGKNSEETLLYDDDPLESIGTGQVYRGSTLPVFLQSIELPFVNNSFCDDTLTDEDVGDHHICAGGDIGEGTCFGDSGGPIVIAGSAADGSEDTQVGLTSFGKPCAVGLPDVFTRLAFEEISDWIQDTMKNHS
jgi:trypsin